MIMSSAYREIPQYEESKHRRVTALTEPISFSFRSFLRVCWQQQGDNVEKEIQIEVEEQCQSQAQTFTPRSLTLLPTPFHIIPSPRLHPFHNSIVKQP